MITKEQRKELVKDIRNILDFAQATYSDKVQMIADLIEKYV